MKKILLLSVATASLVLAAEADVKKDDAFVTHTELGYIETQGNTATQTFNLDANVKKGWDKHIFAFSIDAQYATESQNETKNKYTAELNYDYEFTDRFAFSYLVGYKDDKFSGFSYQAYTGPGAKYKALMSETQNLSLEGSILYSQDDKEDAFYDNTGTQLFYPFTDGTKDDTKTVNGEVLNYGSYRAKGVYSLQVLENLKFNQDLSYRASFEDEQNYFVTSKTAFSSKISAMFSAGLSYKVDYINLPADGKEYSDRTFTANLVIDY